MVVTQTGLEVLYSQYLFNILGIIQPERLDILWQRDTVKGTAPDRR